MNTRKQSGFTIIEVVLVLAIAGLIFLMVFIALPALQRGQRDTGRKSDVNIVGSAITTYLSNNKSDMTALDSTKLQSYVDNLSQYDKANVTVIAIPASGTVTGTTDTIQVVKKAKCGGVTAASVTVTAGSARQTAVITALENNGTTTIGFCQDV